MSQDPAFYAQLRSAIVNNGPRIDRIEVRVGADVNGAGGTAVHEVTELKDRGPDEIMAEIKESMHADAQYWPGIVRYQIACLSHEGAILGGRMLYEIRGRGKEVPTGDPEEEATGKGVTSQHMRFTEGMFKTYTGSMVTMLDIFARELASQREQNARLVGEHMRVMAYGEDLLDRRAERELWLKREQRTDNLKEKAFEALFAFAPQLLGHVAQGTKLEEPAKQLAQGSALSRLTESFKKDPERFEKILACFSAEEKLGLMSGDFGPILAAITRAGKVSQGAGDEDDLKVAMRLAPLAELLLPEEKAIVAQIAEMAAKKAEQTATGEPPLAKEPAKSIEVKEVKPSNVVPIADAKKGA